MRFERRYTDKPPEYNTRILNALADWLEPRLHPGIELLAGLGLFTLKDKDWPGSCIAVLTVKGDRLEFYKYRGLTPGVTAVDPRYFELADPELMSELEQTLVGIHVMRPAHERTTAH